MIVEKPTKKELDEIERELHIDNDVNSKELESLLDKLSKKTTYH